MPTTVYGYIRMEGDDGSEEDHLHALLSAHAAESMTMADVFVDRSTPPTRIVRPGLTELLAQLRRTEGRAVLVADLNHLSTSAPVRHTIEVEISTRWAYYRPPTGGKVTWCSLPLPAKTDVAAGNAEPLPSRQRPARAAEPIEVFDDLATLQRVADALRALDWDLPPGEGVGR
ncbi:recombinase family protein [Frankia sp. CiP3]|uniref:recombinase family protein n=1 Tax=Frankia sp. CiP3 TaxID=2880971 RepID=UPI001EF463D5|nr:recombinase family protein [Frankia sp. CiP3]